MTARESSAFDEMFATIFKVASDSEKGGNNAPSTVDERVGIGRGSIDDLIGKLHKFKRLKPSRKIDVDLDLKKEEIDMCDTDADLLKWASREVFDKSQRYEKEARQRISQAQSSGLSADLPMLQPPEYSDLLAYLMSTFRDKFHDPYVALALFERARSLSIASYVFGCSTPAYNELIETRWKCFRNLKGVHDALKEMKVNGVKYDSRTRKLAEIVRRHVGERNLQFGDTYNDAGDPWTLITKIDQLMAFTTPLRPGSSTPTGTDEKPMLWDAWKRYQFKDLEGDAWGFNQWDQKSKSMMPSKLRERKKYLQ